MKFFNPWHDVIIGENAPDVVHAIIEIPKDGQIKYELDKESGMLKLDRFLFSSMHYPGDYGFVPQTLWYDNDPLDILILTHRPVQPLTLANARIIGVLRIVDGDEKDDKILAVYDKDPRYAEFKDVNDLPKHIVKELTNFFERYKELQGKQVRVLEVLSRRTALNDVEVAKKMYEEKFGKK